MEKRLSRSEQRALEAYPIKMTPLVYQDLIDQFGGKTEIDVNTYPRCLFQQGYEQAEKDLALTIDDIKKIDELLANIILEEVGTGDSLEEFYKEVLKRYLEGKK